MAQALLTYVRDKLGDWSYSDAKSMPVPFGFSEWLIEAADRLGVLSRLELHELTAVLALPSSFDEYLGGLPRKQRHELSRKMRRFDRELPGAVLKRSSASDLEADLNSFFELHRGSQGRKGEFMSPARARFFERVAGAFVEKGELSLDSLQADGRMVAATFSFEYEGVFYLYNSAYDPNLKSVSPGLILVARLIEQSIEKGLRRFDFLRGRERYKYDLGAEALPLHSILVRRS